MYLSKMENSKPLEAVTFRRSLRLVGTEPSLYSDSAPKTVLTKIATRSFVDPRYNATLLPVLQAFRMIQVLICEFGQVKRKLLFVFVIFETQVGYQFFTGHAAQRILELDVLNEQIVLGIEAFGHLWALVEEREPFLNAFESGSLSEIAEQRQV